MISKKNAASWIFCRYWLPDFNYHYELPDANLEVIVADTNGKVKPDAYLKIESFTLHGFAFLGREIGWGG